MYSGISGMRNFQTKLDVIGNNIANVNTFGYKKSRVTFKDSMNQMVAGASGASEFRGGKNSMQVGLGSALSTIDTIHTGSSLQSTNSPMDLGIDGDGYFVVKQGSQEFYTRAGNLYLDNQGNLVNADGLKVQAYKIDPTTGKPTNQYGDVSVNVNAVLPAVATENVIGTGNLSADAAIGSIYTQQMKVVDKDGKEHKVDVHFKKTGDKTWDVYVDNEPDAKDKNGAPVNKNGTITFKDDGTLDQNDVKWTPSGDGWPTTGQGEIKFDFTKLTGNKGATTAAVDPDGNLEGTLESFSFGPMGEINAVYSNGKVNNLGVLALAKFSNPGGLTKAGSNLFQASINSGTANIGQPGEGRGVIAAGTLEMSNVDLSEEFTEMITAQRGFQANTRIITTSDEILQELVNLKR